MGLFTTGALRGSALGRLFASCLEALRAGNKQAIDGKLLADTPGTLLSNLYQVNGVTPAWYWGQINSDVVVVLIDGATTFQMGLSCLSGFFQVSPAGFNTWANDAAQALYNELLRVGRWQSTASFVVGGYSAGGMVGTLLADQRWRRDVTRRVGIHTFGSPRVTTRALADSEENLPCVRWMSTDDPIPLLPLRFADAPWVVAVQGPIAAIQAGTYCHWAGGWELIPGQVGRRAELPSTAAVSPVSSLGAWLTSSDQAIVGSHSIGGYSQAMILEYNLIVNANANPLRWSPPEVSDTQQRRFYNQQQREVAASIASAEERQNAYPVQIPQGNVWVAVRLGRVWTVQFGGVQVAISRSKKAAKGLARLMNEAFRRLQRTAVVDPNALTTQLDGYLVAASDPTGAFRPVLNTTF
jgi:Lipase (class 3)